MKLGLLIVFLVKIHRLIVRIVIVILIVLPVILACLLLMEHVDVLIFHLAI